MKRENRAEGSDHRAADSVGRVAEVFAEGVEGEAVGA
jgi:hypothetical protein